MENFIKKYGVYIGIAAVVVLGVLWWSGNCSGDSVTAAFNSSTSSSQAEMTGVTDLTPSLEAGDEEAPNVEKATLPPTVSEVNIGVLPATNSETDDGSDNAGSATPAVPDYE